MFQFFRIASRFALWPLIFSNVIPPFWSLFWHSDFELKRQDICLHGVVYTQTYRNRSSRRNGEYCSC